MCGIVGFISRDNVVKAEVISRMSSTLTHRGPDDSGYWLNQQAGLALGHRRLSIVDLSPLGHQPMHSSCGRYVIVFNGEIYNFIEVKKKLEDQYASLVGTWRGNSDTEVMLAAISSWGLEAALESFVGMFAFALWDTRERLLHLARDRVGEKPLYYGEVNESFVFGSELKAILAFPNANLEIERNSIASLMQFGYVASPQSIYRGIHKLPSGSILSIVVSEQGRFRYGKPKQYWSIQRKDIESCRSRFALRDDSSLIDELHDLLQSSVEQQMLADVPLGAFLSGGVDSSLIVGLMQAKSKRSVKTFTIGFHEPRFNEANYAKAVAHHLGTEHTELYVSSSQAAEVIPHLPEIYDEPFADSSQIPTFLVSQMTRNHVTVALSGDGGDELFGGYPRYQFGGKLWGRINKSPKWARHAVSSLINSMSAKAWDQILDPVLPNRFHDAINGHRLHRLAQLFDSTDLDQMYCRLVSQWQEPNNLVLGLTETGLKGAGKMSAYTELSALNRMRQFDIARYLPDDILTKVDRASMSVSLETRAPMLDHRLVEFAWNLPERVLVREGQGKWLLRQVLDRYVPRNIIERPKAGFAIPLGDWLRGNLKDWAENLLDEKKLREQGFLDPKPIRRMWREHLSSTHDRQAYLWNVLMFQAWLEKKHIHPLGIEGS